MVEVTKANFEDMIPHLTKAIQNCSFLAVDTEFTGLDLGSLNNLKLFDSHEERYQKMKARASSFIICQIGLSIFTKEKDQNVYSIETYVFYVRPTFCGSHDKRFICQASSISFLCAHGFDFNKFLKDGIPYINEVEEQQFCKELEDGSATYPHEKLMDIRQKKKQDILINELLNSDSKHSTENQEYQEDKKKVILLKDRISHEYFQVNELRCKYPSLWAYCENDSVIAEKVSPEEKKKLEQTAVKEKIKLLEYFLGFTRIFRLMKESKKPIVGHNLLMDLLLIFDHFHRPLPKTYKEFKKELHDVFSVVYDTRHIWRHVKKFYSFKEIPTRCGLFDLYEMFKSPSDVLTTLYSPAVHHCNGEKYLTEEFPHESGYDSFVTGWVFLKICHLLAMKKIQSSVFIKPQTFKQHLSAVEPFVNKLNLGRSRVDYINLDGEDPIPNVPEFLHVQVKNKKLVLTQYELNKVFDKYGMLDYKLAGNKREAILAVGNLRCYKDILRDFQNDKEFIVTKYDVFKHSPIVNSALWFTAIASGCMVSYLIYKLISTS